MGSAGAVRAQLEWVQQHRRPGPVWLYSRSPRRCASGRRADLQPAERPVRQGRRRMAITGLTPSQRAALIARPFIVTHALWLGPTQEFARHWLRGRSKLTPMQAAPAPGAGRVARAGHDVSVPTGFVPEPLMTDQAEAISTRRGSTGCSISRSLRAFGLTFDHLGRRPSADTTGLAPRALARPGAFQASPVATLADFTGAAAGMTMLPPGSAAATVDYTAKFLTDAARRSPPRPRSSCCARAPPSTVVAVDLRGHRRRRDALRDDARDHSQPRRAAGPSRPARCSRRAGLSETAPSSRG